MPKFYPKTILSDEYSPDEGVIVHHVLKTAGFRRARLEFLSVNSPYRQGVVIRNESPKGLLNLNQTEARALQIWSDTAPRANEIILEKNIAIISIHNTWDKGRGPEAYMYKSGMIVEKVAENKYIYRCHDVAEPAEFNKIVFSLELME